MNIEFIKLNQDWNAEPNSPQEKVHTENSSVILEFTVNPWAYDGFKEGERARLIFKSSSKYRLGATNDEGWYQGKCRYGNQAPDWGEFYMVKERSPIAIPVNDWVNVNSTASKNHYLLYLRDNTFECIADSYEFQRNNNE